MQKTVKPFRISRLLKGEPSGTDARCPFCGSKDFNGVDEHMVGWQRFSGDFYDSYDAEIGSYSYVTCTECENLVYASPEWYRSDEEITEVLTKMGLPGDADHWLVRSMNSMRVSVLLSIVYPAGPPETAFLNDDDPNGV